jgi:predicted dehydrogenase
MGDLRVAVVGLGWVAEAHIDAYQAANGAKVTAVCSQRNPSPAEVEARYGVPVKVYSCYDELLTDPEIDVVSLCTENMFHAEQAIAAVQAGKHVYVEKPVALSYADASRMREAIRASGLKACVGFECRYSKQLSLLYSVVDKGLLGDIHYGEADYYHGIGPWYGQFRWSAKKDGGGSALLSGGCHALDALLFLMRDPVEEVCCYGSRSKADCFAAYEFDSCSVTLLKFANGQVGKVTACIDCLQPYYFHFHLVGSKGSLLDNKLFTTELPGLNQERWSTLETALLDSGEVTDHPYLPQMQAFIDSIHNGVDEPLTNFEQGFRSHQVMFAAEQSARLGRAVKLSELE